MSTSLRACAHIHVRARTHVCRCTSTNTQKMHANRFEQAQMTIRIKLMNPIRYVHTYQCVGETSWAFAHAFVAAHASLRCAHRHVCPRTHECTFTPTNKRMNIHVRVNKKKTQQENKTVQLPPASIRKPRVACAHACVPSLRLPTHTCVV